MSWWVWGLIAAAVVLAIVLGYKLDLSDIDWDI